MGADIGCLACFENESRGPPRYMGRQEPRQGRAIRSAIEATFVRIIRQEVTSVTHRSERLGVEVRRTALP